MRADTRTTITDCDDASEAGRITFPQLLGQLHAAGVEGYLVDFRTRTKTYYLPDGTGLGLPAAAVDTPISAAFDAGIVEGAVRNAQANAPGYTYEGFCREMMAGGCAGYIVSILGRRVVYFGRTAETHVEHFPT